MKKLIILKSLQLPKYSVEMAILQLKKIFYKLKKKKKNIKMKLNGKKLKVFIILIMQYIYALEAKIILINMTKIIKNLM